MKMNKIFFGVLAALALSLSFTSCSDDDDPKPVPVPEPDPSYAAFVLNEGSWGYNNSTLTAFNWKDNTVLDTECVYSAVNGQSIGDVGQDLIFADNGYLYMSVFGSAYIVKMDETGKELCRASI